MTEVSAVLVKTLREKTGAGMMDCKKALHEVNGDLDSAVDWLRKKGLSAAAKKAGRVAAEGLVGIASGESNCACVVEINSETDFVSRNDQFQKLVKDIANLASAQEYDSQSVLQAKLSDGNAVSDSITNLVAVIGENISYRRHKRICVSEGVVSTYIHNSVVENLGKIGVLVALESKADKNKLHELGKKIAMHIAAASPHCLDISSVSPEALEKEKVILTEQAKASGRPDDVIQKMVEGRIRKYYEEVVLLEQVFVMDGKTKISQVVENASKELGTSIVLKDFARFALGEGIEKQVSDFAAEVKAQAGQ